MRSGTLRLGLPGGAIDVPVEYEGAGVTFTLLDTAGRPHTFDFFELPAKEGGEPGMLYLKSIFTSSPGPCRYCGRELDPPRCHVCDNEE